MKNFLLILGIFLFSTLTAHAADVSIMAPKNISNNQPFVVLVNLNTGGALINSFDITLTYPKAILAFKGYKEDGAIKKIWLVSPNDNDGTIKLSGIIPGGVQGVYDPDKSGLQPIPLVALLFTPQGNGTGEFTIIHSDILQNDGLGTPLIHDDINSYISISSNQPEISKAGKNNIDILPPEPFTINYIPASFFSKTPSMIWFSTTDLGSGVEKYQLLTTNDKWKDVKSPLPTQKDILKKDITIRALDFYGNTRLSTVEIPGLLSTTQLSIIIFITFLCCLLFYRFKIKK